jgi:hypothetical protein
MRTFAAALVLFASAKARYPHEIAPAKFQPHRLTDNFLPNTYYAIDAPLQGYQLIDFEMEEAAPYFPTDFQRESVHKELTDEYEEAVNIVKGIAHGADFIHKKLEHTKRMMPGPRPVEEVYEVVMEDDEVLPVHEAITDYEHYCRTGRCDLSECAYGQCV